MRFVSKYLTPPWVFGKWRKVWALVFFTLVLFGCVFGVLVGTGTRPSFLGGDDQYPSLVAQIIDGCQRITHVRLAATLADGVNGDHKIVLSGTLGPPRKKAKPFDGTVDGFVAESAENCDIRIEVTTWISPQEPTVGPGVSEVDTAGSTSFSNSLHSMANPWQSAQFGKATNSYLLPLDPLSVPEVLPRLQRDQIASNNPWILPDYSDPILEQRHMVLSEPEMMRYMPPLVSDSQIPNDKDESLHSIQSSSTSKIIPESSMRTDVFLIFNFDSGAFKSGYKKHRLHLLLALWNSDNDTKPAASRQSMVQVFFPYKALRLSSVVPVTFSWGADLDNDLDAVIWDGRLSAPYTHYTGVIAGGDVEFDENDVAISAETLTIICSALIGAAISSIIGLLSGLGGYPSVDRAHSPKPDGSGQAVPQRDEPDTPGPPSSTGSTRQDGLSSNRAARPDDSSP